MTGEVKKAKKSRTYLILIGISVTYIFIYYLLMKETELCDATKFKIRDHWFHGFWDRYLGCRSINELGDALAGAFAPVAFIWLAGTVFIQSKELEAQRKELDETQEVMREQLEVAREQVKETKASTSLFKEQTNILKRQQDLREREISDLEFESAVEALKVIGVGQSSLNAVRTTSFYLAQKKQAGVISFGSERVVEYMPLPVIDDLIWYEAVLERDIFNNAFKPHLPGMCQRIRKVSYELTERWAQSDTGFHLLDVNQQANLTEALDLLLSEFERLERISRNVSDAKHHEIRTCRLDQTAEALSALKQCVVTAGLLRDKLVADGLRFET